MSERQPSRQASADNAWTVPVALEEIPEAGRHIELTADPATREATARLAGVAGLPRWKAAFDVARHGSDGVRVTGSVSATVDQTCIVTLEPIQSEIDEAVDLLFTAQPQAGGAEDESQGALPPESADPPEALRDGVIDLGAVATEFLLLGINPYPRKEGAVFDAPPAGDPGAHPFATLAALKKGPTGSDP